MKLLKLVWKQLNIEQVFWLIIETDFKLIHFHDYTNFRGLGHSSKSYRWYYFYQSNEYIITYNHISQESAE